MNDRNSLKRWIVPMTGASLTAASLLWAQDTGRTPRAVAPAVKSPVAQPAAAKTATGSPKAAAPAKAGAPAKPGDTKSANDAAVAEIRATAHAYLKAIHAADFQAAAVFWNPAGDYVDSDGVTHNVHELFAKRRAELEENAKAAAAKTAEDSAQSGKPAEVRAAESAEAGKAPAASGEPSAEAGKAPAAAAELVHRLGTIRLVTPDVAIEDGSWHVPNVPERRANIRFTAVWTRSQGAWRLDSLRESIHALESPAERLKTLSWLVGEWEADVGPITLRMRCEPTEDGNFLTRELEAGRDPEHLRPFGSQRIGWDSARHQFKSWVFEADGGSGEAFWTLVGDVWTTQAIVTHPSGAVATATMRYTLVAPDHFRLESVDIQSDGEKKPDVTLDFHRKR